MAIIYTYPTKATPADADLILISDSADSNKTKQVTVASIKGQTAGVTSIIAGNNVTIDPAGGIGDVTINASSGGGTPDTPVNSVQFNEAGAFGGSDNLTFSTDTLTVKDNVIIRGDGTTNAGKLRLECFDNVNTHYIDLIGPDHGGGAASYSVKFPATGPGGNQKILQSDASGVLSWINTPSSGGGGAVDSVNTTDGTFINLTPNAATTGAVTVTADLSATGTAGNTTFLRGDNSWAVPVGTTYSAGTGLALNTTTFSLAAGAALTNLGGGAGSTFLKKDGTWATPTNTNTNIANNNLQLDNNRNLDLSNGDATDYALTFISTLGGASKNLFKFDQIGGASPQFTVGHTESAYEGYIALEGNGSNRTGILKFENAAGTYYTSFQAPTTFGANQNIGYVLPNSQGAANSVLTNNGSGTLSWSGIGEAGTWTPAPWTYSGSGPTVVSANGTYSIVGDICHITFQIIVTGSSSSNAAMILDGLPALAQGDASSGEQSAGLLFVNTDSNTYDAIPSMFYVSGDKLTMVVQGGSKNSLTAPYGLKAQDVVANWYRPSAGSGITLKGSATYKLA